MLFRMNKFTSVATMAMFGLLVFEAGGKDVKLMAWAVNDSINKNNQAEYKKDIASNGIDMGVFESCKADNYFISSDFTENGIKYATTVKSFSTRNSRYAISKAEEYALLHFTPEAPYGLGGHMAAVYEDRDGETFVLVNLNGTYTKTPTDIGGYLDGLLAAHPDAQYFVSYTAKTTAASVAFIHDYLVNVRNLRCLGQGTSGAYYAFSDRGVSNPAVTDIKPEHATYCGTICAVSIPDRFKVEFQDWDGAVIQSGLIARGASVVPPTNPTRDGYVFAGWGCDESAFASVSQRMILTAQYELNQSSRKITILDWDGSLVVETAVDDGTVMTAPEAVVRKGYEFLGWYSGETPYDFTQPVTEDLTLQPKYALVTLHTIDSEEEFVEKIAWGLPAEACYKLTRDLDFSGMTYTPVDFAATLDGVGFSITGLANTGTLFNKLTGTVRNLTLRNIGAGDDAVVSTRSGVLSCSASGATVESCVLENCNRTYGITNGEGGGFFAASQADDEGRCTVISNCVMRNCRVNGQSNNVAMKVGGFVAYATGTRIMDSRFLSDEEDVVTIGNGTVTAGSFVGFADGDVVIERCVAEGYVRVTGSSGSNAGAGGIVGGVGGTCEVYDCTNRARVVGCHQNGNGGIIGRACKTRVVIGRCVNYGPISAELYGTANNAMGIGAGGILGGNWYNTSATLVFDSANFGAVTSGTNAVPAGGIVASADGYNGSTDFVVSNCLNYASVSSPSVAGGVIGAFHRVWRSQYNIGNYGDVSGGGAAGGIMGEITYHLNNTSSGVRGVLQAGVVTAGDNGSAGLVVGRLLGANNQGCSFVLRGAVLAGRVSAGENGQTAIVCAKTDPLGTADEIAYSLDDGFRVLSTDLVHCYNKSNEPMSFDSVDPMTVQDLTGRNATKWLNDYAEANGHMPWIRGQGGPELSLFGTPARGSLIIIVR